MKNYAASCLTIGVTVFALNASVLASSALDSGFLHHSRSLQASSLEAAPQAGAPLLLAAGMDTRIERRHDAVDNTEDRIDDKQDFRQERRDCVGDGPDCRSDNRQDKRHDTVDRAEDRVDDRRDRR
jgi:hypothetical protein